MATVKTVKVSCAYLKSLPNYENVKVEASAELDVADGENPKEVYSKGWDMVGAEISKQLALFGKPATGVKKGL